ncbi:Spo0B C-terminal domain-containing protein [Salibacterium sp. K-3]
MDAQRQLDILRHARHDWMNIVQIIKGNLSLNRLDRIEEILNETIRKTEHESRLSHLGIPKTALFLLTFNWEQHRLSLDVEVPGECRDCSDLEDCWYEMLSSFTKELDAAVEPGAENHLLVTIHTEPEPYLEVDFQGTIVHSPPVTDWLTVYADTGRCQLDHMVWNDKELVFVLTSE